MTNKKKEKDVEKPPKIYNCLGVKQPGKRYCSFCDADCGMDIFGNALPHDYEIN